MRVIRWLRSLFGRENAPLDVAEFEKEIEYRFRDRSLLVTSLKHRSYAQTVEGSIAESNERLEFLGDSVLNMVVSHAIFMENGDFDEGELTKLKSVLVSRKAAAEAGRRAGLHRFILLSESEEHSGGRNRHSIIADAYEAVVGALFLDGGLEEAEKFIRKTALDDSCISRGLDHKNYKSILLEKMQALKNGHPRYRTISEDGPDHQKVFTVEVIIDNVISARGRGKNKKAAQQMAAKSCLEELMLNDGDDDTGKTSGMSADRKS